MLLQLASMRTTIRDGEPWFVAADVCRALEIKNARDAVARLDDDEKGVVLTDTPGGQQKMNVVNEPGLYALVLGSRKPEAGSRDGIKHPPPYRILATYTIRVYRSIEMARKTR